MNETCVSLHMFVFSLDSVSDLLSGKEGTSAGAVDEEDFIKSFEDVPAVQVCVHTHLFIYLFFAFVHF